MGWSKDIRFWILLLFAVRLFGITNPPLETTHNWRQATVNMVARNFHEQGVDLLHPRVDMAGELSGITGMEFPVLSALIALVADLFGYDHWYGRLIVLIVSSFGLWAFHQLLLRYFDDSVAFWSTLLLGVSLWFTYGRKVMPDVFALSLVLLGLHAAACSLFGRRTLLNGALAVVTIMIGCASKLPAGCLLAVLPLMLWQAPASSARRIGITSAIALGLVPIAWWYFVQVPALEAYEGYRHFFMGKGMAQGASELAAHLDRTIDNFYFDAMRFSGFAAFVAGTVLMVVHRQRALALVLSACSLLFLLVMLKAGDTFWMHQYYVLPFVPVMALFAGYTITAIPSAKWRAIAMVLIAAEGIGNQWHDFRISPIQAPLLGLEKVMDGVSDRHDLVVINSAAIPTPMYFAHRKGWLAYRRDLVRPAYLDSINALGCRYVVIIKNGYEGDLPMQQPIVASTAAFTIHSLAH